MDSGSKEEFYKTFHNIDRINQRNAMYSLPSSPHAVYINETIRLGVLPKPMGISRHHDESEIDINRYGIGERYAKAFSKCLEKRPKITKLDLFGNRMTH